MKPFKNSEAKGIYLYVLMYSCVKKNISKKNNTKLDKVLASFQMYYHVLYNAHSNNNDNLTHISKQQY